MKLLKYALMGNAGFSIISGLTLSLLPNAIAEVFQVSNFTPFLLVGLGLLFFSYTILIEIKLMRRIKVLWIIVQDLLWVLGSTYLWLFQPLEISAVGYQLIAGVAGVVLLFAIAQAVGWWSKEKMMTMH